MISAIHAPYTKVNSCTRYKSVDHSIRFCIDLFMDEELSRYEALVLCRDRAGSDSQMGRDFGVPQPKVWRWINQSKQMPAEYVLLAERLYAVSRHHLRPDIYPIDMPEASSRWSGVDQRVGVRRNGVDGRNNRVSFNDRQITKGASL